MTVTKGLCLALLLTITAPAWAAPEQKDLWTNLQTQEKALTEKATPQAQDQFNKIKTAHGTIRAVRHVSQSLDRAIKSCVAHNKDMQENLQKSFQDWKNSVLPVVRQAQNKLDKMILTQSIAKPDAIRSYLTTFDQMVRAEDAKVKEIPIKDAAACEAMMKNLKNSERIMAGLLRETLGLDNKN